MYSVILQPPSTNQRLLSLKLPIMHVIGNSGDGVVWSGFCVKTDTVPRFPRSSGVLKSSQRFWCVEFVEKKEISKLEGKRKKEYENPNFPTTSDFQSTLSLRLTGEFEKPIINLMHLPSHRPRCAYRFLWFLNTHALMLFERCVGFGFSEAVGLQTYVEGSGVR